MPAGKNGYGFLNILNKGIIAADKPFQVKTTA